MVSRQRSAEADARILLSFSSAVGSKLVDVMKMTILHWQDACNTCCADLDTSHKLLNSATACDTV